MVKLLRVTSVVFTVLLAGGIGGGATAHSPSDPEAVGNIERLSAAANLVIHGKVTRVYYRMSAPGANGSVGIPYTFVTYSILKVLQGAAPKPIITLRFIG